MTRPNVEPTHFIAERYLEDCNLEVSSRIGLLMASLTATQSFLTPYI